MLILVGCGVPEFRSSTLQEYIDIFEQETCIDTSGVNAQMVDILPSQGSSVMYCLRGTTTIIQARIDFWKPLNEWKRMGGITHEIGHCVLGIISHTNDLNENYEPVSVMHEQFAGLITEELWEQNKIEYYIPLIKLAKTKNKLKKDCVPITEQ